MILKERTPKALNKEKPHRNLRTRVILTLLVLIISLGLISFAVDYYRRDQALIRDVNYAALSAVEQLKIGQIVQWRQERQKDAQLYSGDRLLASTILAWINQPQDAGLKNNLLERLAALHQIGKYQNVMIADTDGRVLIAAEVEPSGQDPNRTSLVLQAVRQNRVIFGDFDRRTDTGQIHIDVVAPVLDPNNKVAAALILRTDPQAYLYPLIQSWPLPSASAETLLVRRDGDQLVYLNTLRHRSDAPLTLRMPLTNLELPAVEAVLGRTGIYEGRDYLGQQVLAELQPVPDSPWFMIAKINIAEIMAEAVYHGWVTASLTALAIFLVVCMAAFLEIYRQRFIYQRLLIVEQERRRAQDEIRATLYGIGDGVIATDVEGLVTRLNPAAEFLTGWPEAEAIGKPLSQVFRIINEITLQEVSNPAERALLEGKVIGLANHTLLISRDGSQRAIADSAAPIWDEEHSLAGVVLVFRDQELERAAQKALQASQQKFMTIFQFSPDAILLTSLPDGRIVDANETASRMTGFTREELIGQTTAGLGLWLDDQQNAAFSERVQRGERITNFEAAFRSRHGSRIEALISGDLVLIESGPVYLSVARDDTSRKQSELETRKREALLRALIDNAPFEIWARDINQVFILENATRVRRRGSMLGKKLEDCAVSPQELEIWSVCDRLVLAGQIVDAETDDQVDGSPHFFQSILAPIFEGLDVAGIVGFDIDISARKQIEKALEVEKDELTRSNAELEQFAYVASHDLQEPLRMVSSYMQLIEKRYRGKLDQDANEFIGYAVDGATRMQRLISDLLLFSRVGTHGRPLARVDCEAVFAQALHNLKLSIQEHQALVTHDPLPEVLGDAQQLVQLFQNLVANAIKFQTEQAPRVHLSAQAEAGEWVFRLSDNGIGIDPQHFERIFVLFQRLHERSAYPGTGIGLAVCKKIVQRHGGRIWVESQKGQGTTFYFSLPGLQVSE